MSDLTDYERKVLAAFAGNAVDALQQGAALNQAAERLVALDYMSALGELHDKGYAELGFTSPQRTSTKSTGATPTDGGENGT